MTDKFSNGEAFVVCRTVWDMARDNVHEYGDWIDLSGQSGDVDELGEEVAMRSPYCDEEDWDGDYVAIKYRGFGPLSHMDPEDVDVGVMSYLASKTVEDKTPIFVLAEDYSIFDYRDVDAAIEFAENYAGEFENVQDYIAQSADLTPEEVMEMDDAAAERYVQNVRFIYKYDEDGTESVLAFHT